MHSTKKTFQLITGFSLVAAVAVLAGAWVPGQTRGPSTDKWQNIRLLSSNLPCDCGPEAGVPGQARPTPRIAPGEWCITQQVFEAQKGRGTDVSVTAACPTEGAPDNPAIRDAAIPDANSPIKTVRLIFHVFAEDSGANPAASAADVQTAVDRLNANYGPWRYQFVYEYRFINSTKYRYLDRNTETGGMKKAYSQSPSTKLNIFVVDTGGVCWGTFPGTSFALTKDGGVVMDDTWFGISTNLPSILSHEVGHCLGLWHTFHGVDEVNPCSDCYEPAGRSAAVGDTTGDFCSDTQPTLRTATACADPAGTDPCSGNPWIDTPYQNFMSYSNQCAIEFTPQQAGRMHAWTNLELTSWLVPIPPPNVPGTPSLSTSGGIVSITWADNSGNETGFEVQREKKANGNKWGGTTTIGSYGANVTSTTDASGAGTFRYRVRAFSGGTYSAYSAWAQINN